MIRSSEAEYEVSHPMSQARVSGIFGQIQKARPFFILSFKSHAVGCLPQRSENGERWVHLGHHEVRVVDQVYLDPLRGEPLLELSVVVIVGDLKRSNSLKYRMQRNEKNI